jgi:protein arginine kinase activator
MEFRAEGRLGCPHDYEVFRVGLLPLLERIHRAQRHVGKVPRQPALDPQRLAELAELRSKLREAVEVEAYEDAARLRDLIRQKEATDESG